MQKTPRFLGLWGKRYKDYLYAYFGVIQHVVHGFPLFFAQHDRPQIIRTETEENRKTNDKQYN